MPAKHAKPIKRSSGPNLFSLLPPYKGLIATLALLAVAGNALTLWLPKIISHAIDAYAHQTLTLATVAWQFGAVIATIFVLAWIQNIVQVVSAERVARDLRNTLAAKISHQNFAFIQDRQASTLLTNLTSDIDSVKVFVAQVIATMISSAVLIIGAAIILLTIDWQLALAVLTIVPVIGVTFFLTLRKVRALFLKSRTIIDWLNKVINESILGAALVRVLHAERTEKRKFAAANRTSRDLGLSIVNIFAGLIPVITLVANAATLIILALGGHYVLTGSVSLGDFVAFTSYIEILIFPILVLGFISNLIAQAQASYGRVAAVLSAPNPKPLGTKKTALKGDIAVTDVTVTYGEKPALKGVSLQIKAGSRTAILGPTAAGKTQLLYAMSGLIAPDKGAITYDGETIDAYDPQNFYSQVGIVFQDSIVFNLSLRENIAFSKTVSDKDVQLAVETAELHDLVAALPEKLDTVISERGTSLSGGQKQRLMLARALALNPKVLLLDDFTARVDTATEAKILANVQKNYPDLTLVSVTQKVASVTDYDQIIVLMEGEVLATGTHAQLMKKSPEYVQIYRSQQSTEHL